MPVLIISKFDHVSVHCNFALPGTTFSPLQVYGKIILSLKGKQLRSE